MEQSFSSIVNVAAILAAGMLIGMLVGFAFARTGQRRGTDNDRIRERLEFDNLQSEHENLQTEYDDYRDKVEVHFTQTSEAFKETTEQYRALYQRIAAGAVELCDPESVKPILASASDASNAMNAVTQAASATVTSFPRKSSADSDDSLGDALADMRTQMNELDQAIDDLKADVIEPTRKDLQQRGVIDGAALPADTTTKDTSKQDGATPDRATVSAPLHAIENSPGDQGRRHEPTATNVSSLTAVASTKTGSASASAPQGARPTNGSVVTASATPRTDTSNPVRAVQRVSEKAPNGAVNDIKNATRETKRRLFQAGRIISPGSSKTSANTGRLQVPPPVGRDRVATSPAIRLER